MKSLLFVLLTSIAVSAFASEVNAPKMKIKCMLAHMVVFEDEYKGVRSSSLFNYDHEKPTFDVDSGKSSKATVLISGGDGQLAITPIFISFWVPEYKGESGYMLQFAVESRSKKFLGGGSLQFGDGITFPAQAFLKERVSHWISIVNPSDNELSLALSCWSE